MAEADSFQTGPSGVAQQQLVDLMTTLAFQLEVDSPIAGCSNYAIILMEYPRSSVAFEFFARFNLVADVAKRTSHARRFAFGVAHPQPTRLHPHPRSVTVTHPVLALKVLRSAFEVGFELRLHVLQVVGVNQLIPRLDTRAGNGTMERIRAA